MATISRAIPLALGAALLLASVPSRAELSDEIQVYTDDINAPGEFGLELHVNTTPRGRRLPDYPGEVAPHHGLRITPEFSYGLSKDWEAGVYLPMSRDAGGNSQLAGVKLRLKWLPVRPEAGSAGWFVGANGELSRLKHQFSQARTSAELRLMGGWRSADWLFALNPVFGWNLSDGLASPIADVSMGAKVARSITGDLALGIEYYADLGTTKRIRFSSRQAQSLYATVDMRVAGIDLNFGIGHGLNSAADTWTMKAIVGFPL